MTQYNAQLVLDELTRWLKQEEQAFTDGTVRSFAESVHGEANMRMVVDKIEALKANPPVLVIPQEFNTKDLFELSGGICVESQTNPHGTNNMYVHPSKKRVDEDQMHGWILEHNVNCDGHRWMIFDQNVAISVHGQFEVKDTVGQSLSISVSAPPVYACQYFAERIAHRALEV